MQISEKNPVTENIKENILLNDALEKISFGLKILPCKGKVPSNRIKEVAKLRKKPINAANAAFYFPYDPSSVDHIAILTGDKHEAIDVDAKHDLDGNINSNFLSALQFSLSEGTFEKLVIVKTPSGGIHVHYKCPQIGGCGSLAARHATTEERAKGERKLTLIDVKGEGGYITCPPSPGYEFIQNDLSDMPLIPIEDRQIIKAIAVSFDKIKEPELKGVHRSQISAGDAPWVVFNRDHDYKWMLQELLSSGFSFVKEDDSRIYILRDGSSAKTSGAIWKDSNILYLFSTSTQFESDKPYSAFGILCVNNYDGKLHDCAKDLADQGIGTWNYDEGEFYSIGKRGKIEFKHKEILEWLHETGIQKYFYCDDDFYLVRVLGNKVSLITTDKVKKIFGDYITTTVPNKILNAFISSIGRLFTKEGIFSQLETVDDNRFLKCTAKVGWLFFQNGALKITGNDIDSIQYEDLPGLVWTKRIIERDYTKHSQECHPAEFIQLISGKKPDNEHRYKLVTGYLLHLYKDPVDPKVIILNDEFYDEQDSEPQGGTGKGLYIKLIKQFLQTLSLDGKRFDAKRNFAFQGITPDTQLMVIEDAAKGFCFETWFSTITEDLVVEKKGKNEFRIPFEKSPKILVTTNYAIKGNSSSHLRRRYELEVHPFFNNKKRPIDHFKKRFFEDWNESEWKAFDNYMVECLQMYLNEGLPDQVTVNLEKKKVIQSSNRDFFRWIESIYTKGGLKEVVSKGSFIEQFTTLFPDYALGLRKVSQSKFTHWLTAWCKYRNIALDASNKTKVDEADPHSRHVMAYKFSGTLKGDPEAEVSHEVFENDDSEKFVNEVFERGFCGKPIVTVLPF